MMDVTYRIPRHLLPTHLQNKELAERACVGCGYSFNVMRDDDGNFYLTSAMRPQDKLDSGGVIQCSQCNEELEVFIFHTGLESKLLMTYAPKEEEDWGE